MKILALDLGKFNSTCCFFDTKARKARFLTTPTQREYLTAVFTDNKADLVVMESCGPSGWINDLAQSLGLATLVCSTNEEAWRWANVKRKTDKDDALKLARMAAMRELKPVNMPSQEHREFRSLVKYRKTLADGEPNELWKGELDIELTILDSLTEQMDAVVKKLEAIGKTDPRIVRLQTIPGVVPPRSSSPASTTRIDSTTAAKSRPTSGWCHGNINPVRPIATAESPSEAIHWRERSSLSVPGHR